MMPITAVRRIACRWNMQMFPIEGSECNGDISTTVHRALVSRLANTQDGWGYRAETRAGQAISSNQRLQHCGRRCMLPAPEDRPDACFGGEGSNDIEKCVIRRTALYKRSRT